MKFFYIGGGILILLLAFSLLFGWIIGRHATEASELLSAAIEYMDSGSFDQARDKANAAAESWKTHSHFLSALIGHDELDEIAEGFSRLTAYGVEEDRQEFRSQCQVLIFRLEHIAEMDLPFYYNFFALGLDPPLGDAV